MPLGRTGRQKIAQWYRERAENTAGAEIDRRLQVRRRTRLRLYECLECRKKLRVADDNLEAEHVHVDADTFEETRHRFMLVTIQLSAATPF